ncbi:MAG TPA: phosphatase PAP2 family protein [Geobacteraceae bacterium]|nr:phosphatase PAP2 family protein [Geobacteraceae bacterium]
MKHLRLTILVTASCLVIIFSHLYMDERIAGFFGEMMKEGSVMSLCSCDIPDLLIHIAIFYTVTSWIAYSVLKRRKIDNRNTRFFLLTGCTVPVSFLLKSFLKDLFGKVTTRAWLKQKYLYGFHWLDGGSDFSGFPSGHMLLFMVLALGVIRFYPRFRSASIGFLLLLAVALIVTDYHFLSDIIAGALLGYIVDDFMYYYLFLRKGNA